MESKTHISLIQTNINIINIMLVEVLITNYYELIINLAIKSYLGEDAVQCLSLIWSRKANIVVV